jgi:hypothetical protein
VRLDEATTLLVKPTAVLGPGEASLLGRLAKDLACDLAGSLVMRSAD